MKICLDAGHYKGFNPGIVKGYYEGDVVWKITNLQKKYLEEYKDVTVILTRSDISKDLALTTRGSKSKGCDLFISNHSNACGTESVDRPVIIYAYDNKNKANVLGKKLGQAIQTVMGTKQAYQMMQRKSTSGTTEYYGVMRGARNAGCPLYYIIEHGFHTNKTTCNWLLNDNNLDKLVKAEVEVIAKHFGLVKKTASSTTNNNTSSNSTNTSSNSISVNYLVKIDTESLNVRKGVGVSFDIVTQVKLGGVYTIIEEKDGWGKLKSGAGWINLSYTKKTTLDNTLPSYLVEINTAALNIRKKPTTNSTITGVVTEGQVYTIIEEKDGWGKLKSGAGWINLSYTNKL